MKQLFLIFPIPHADSLCDIRRSARSGGETKLFALQRGPGRRFAATSPRGAPGIAAERPAANRPVHHHHDHQRQRRQRGPHRQTQNFLSRTRVKKPRGVTCHLPQKAQVHGHPGALYILKYMLT